MKDFAWSGLGCMGTGWYKCDHKFLEEVSVAVRGGRAGECPSSDEDMNQISAIEDEEDVTAPITTCIDSLVPLLTPQIKLIKRKRMSQILRNLITIQWGDYIISTSDCLKYLSFIMNKLFYSSGQSPNCLVELQHILLSCTKRRRLSKTSSKVRTL